ncbi:MAG: alpha-glucosidase [Candidatus Marsarchaeota archaeon]|nr:alpha-glucosidase [Candidatus Marsarchaeota archaeon]
MKLACSDKHPFTKVRVNAGARYTRFDDIAVADVDNLAFDLYGRSVEFLESEGNTVEVSVELEPCSHAYGLGEHPYRFDRKRGRYVNWNSDAWGYFAERTKAYLSIPFIVLVANPLLGVFVNSPSRTVFDVGAERRGRLTVTVSESDFDVYFFSARSFNAVLEQYTSVTGRPFDCPEWALGHQVSRWSYYPQQEVLGVVERYLREFWVSAVYLDIHYMDGYRVFTWDASRFPDPVKLADGLHRMGVKVIPIVDVGIKLDQNYDVFKRGLGCYVEDAEGSLYVGRVWPGSCCFPDFLNENGRSFWRRVVSEFVRFGADGVWLDMNEPSIRNPDRTMGENAVQTDDSGSKVSHARVHNAYSYFAAKSTYEALLEAGVDKPYVLSRSGYAGIQKYAAVWTGDNVSSWDDLPLQLSMVMNLGLSGVPYCGCDLGGFEGESSPDLLVRYYQVAALFPIFRNHKSMGGNDQELYGLPTSYKRELVDVFDLRRGMAAHLNAAAKEAHSLGHAVVRPVFYNYPDDPEAYFIPSEYMVGDMVLYAPATKASETHRVYLPKGSGVDSKTGERVEGPQWLSTDNPIQTYLLE